MAVITSRDNEKLKLVRKLHEWEIPGQGDLPTATFTAVDVSAWHIWWKQYGARELRRILMDEWDPIRVRGVPDAADEYDSYLGPIGARLREGKSADEIAAYLTDIEVNRMGLGFSEAARQRNATLARRLRDWHRQETDR